MITRFRVEGRHQDRQELIEQLQSAAGALMTFANDERRITEQEDDHFEWECTDDVISWDQNNGGYIGRMVFRLQNEDRTIVRFGP